MSATRVVAGRKPRSIRKGEGRTYGTSKGREWSPEERAAWREQKRSEADAALADIVGMFESGELPELVAQTMIARAEGVAPMVHWSLGNQLLAIRAGTTDARGFHQWKEVGRSVQKGAKAFRILGPVLVKDRDDATGEDRQKLVGYKLIPVFKIQDTDGIPLEGALDYRPAELPPLFDVAARLGVRVDYMPEHPGINFRGFYSPGGRSISLVTYDPSTFFHELAHAAHDATLRADGKRIEDVADAEREIVAETVAATLCRMYDFDGYLYHGARYVERYADGNPGRAAMRVLADVAKTLYLILDPA